MENPKVDAEELRQGLNQLHKSFHGLEMKDVIGLSISMLALKPPTFISREIRTFEDAHWLMSASTLNALGNFSCQVPDLMYEAGFQETPEPLADLSVGPPVRSKEHYVKLRKIAERFIPWRQGFERAAFRTELPESDREKKLFVAFRVMILNMRKEGSLTFRDSDLARDFLTAERMANPGLARTRIPDPSWDRDTLLDGINGIRLFTEGRPDSKFPVELRGGFLRLRVRQTRDQLAPDSRKRRLTAKGERNAVSLDALASVPLAKAEAVSPVDAAEGAELTRLIRDLRDQLEKSSPSEAAAFDYLYIAEGKVSRKDVALKHGLTPSAIIWAEPLVKAKVEKLRRRLA